MVRPWFRKKHTKKKSKHGGLVRPWFLEKEIEGRKITNKTTSMGYRRCFLDPSLEAWGQNDTGAKRLQIPPNPSIMLLGPMNAVNSNDKDQGKNGKSKYKMKNIYLIGFFNMFFSHTQLHRTKSKIVVPPLYQVCYIYADWEHFILFNCLHIKKHKKDDI